VIDISGPHSEGAGGPQIKMEYHGFGTTKLSHSSGNTYSGVTTRFCYGHPPGQQRKWIRYGNGGLDLRAPRLWGGNRLHCAQRDKWSFCCIRRHSRTGRRRDRHIVVNLRITTGKRSFSRARGLCLIWDHRDFVTSCFHRDVRWRCFLQWQHDRFTNLGGLAPAATLYSPSTSPAPTPVLGARSGLGGSSASLIYNPPSGPQRGPRTVGARAFIGRTGVLSLARGAVDPDCNRFASDFTNNATRVYVPFYPRDRPLVNPTHQPLKKNP